MELKGIYFHHSECGGKMDTIHNQQHLVANTQIERLEEAVADGDEHEIKAARINCTETASQLKVSAKLLNADGEQHRIDILERLNKCLPDDQKLV